MRSSILRYFMLFSLSVLVLLTGLSPAPEALGDEKLLDNPYIPLKIGTSWDYKVGENRFTISVTKHEKVGPLFCARLELLVDKKPKAFEHITVKDGNLVRVTFEGKPATPPIPFLQIPVKDQANWKVGSIIDGQKFEGVFRTKFESNVKVPAGTYEKVITVNGEGLKVAGNSLALTYYFVEKVGMVKQVLKLDNEKVEIELEKFNPAK